MHSQTDDLRIRGMTELATPEEVIRELPCTDRAAATVSGARRAVQQYSAWPRRSARRGDRTVLRYTTCTPRANMRSASHASVLDSAVSSRSSCASISRSRRTTVGWKGLINDPDLDGSFRINEGLRLARRLLVDINELGLPAGCEFLDIITPQYIADLVAWGAVGARTTESQVHRELASGLSCPIGFKNGTDGNVRVAVDAVRAASQPHHFLAVTKQGHSAIAATSGNTDCHVILRGGRTPNYDAAGVAAACREMTAGDVTTRLMIDASHGNSGKRPERQPAVVEDIAAQVEAGDQADRRCHDREQSGRGTAGTRARPALVYGQSITDGCIDWPTSVEVLEQLAAAVARGRSSRAPLKCRAGI